MAAILKIAPGKSTTWETDSEVESKYLLMLRFYSDGQFFFMVVYLTFRNRSRDISRDG